MGLESPRASFNYFFRIASIALIGGLILAIYRVPMFALLKECWDSTEQSQGLVIMPLAIVVAWLRRHLLQGIAPACDIRGLALTAAGCLLHLFGQLAAGLYASQLSFVVVLAGVLWTFGGTAWLRAMALPILLLAMAIPLPSLLYVSLSLPLQLFASSIACRIADFLGIVVYREGNIIHLAGISLGIWEACSGLNSLFSLLAGGVLMGFLVCRFLRTRMLVCAAAIPIAVLSNIVRITGTAILSDWRPIYAMDFYHTFSGWLVFVIGSVTLYGAAVGLRKAFNG